jgi:hypothetical protein
LCIKNELYEIITAFNFRILITILSFAQSPGKGKIKIAVTNEKAIALENATVELINAKDSSLVKIAVTDKTGLAEFEKFPFGSYLLKTTMVNYGTQYIFYC